MSVPISKEFDLPPGAVEGKRLRGRSSPCQWIVREVRRRITSGLWTPGYRLGTGKDLSEEFGVSTATLKKALKKLEREGLIQGHQGKGRFVSSRISRRRVIGLIVYDFEDLRRPALSQRLAGAEKVLQEHGYDFKLIAFNKKSISSGPQAADAWARLINPQEIDGAIVANRQMPDMQVQELASYMPVVRMENLSVRPGLEGACFDVLTAAYDASRHLVELGHRDIALIAISENYWVGREQRQGVELAMRQHLTAGRGRVRMLTAQAFSFKESHGAAVELLRDLPGPTGLICGSDELVLGAVLAIQEAGLKIPRDISVIGWNDTVSDSQVPVPLTEVHVDFQGVGAASALRLLARLDNRPMPRETDRIRGCLVVRQSTAPPPASGPATRGASPRTVSDLSVI